ncbi:hypothetical protein ACFQGA_16050 [Marinobacter koreensis]|jgi:hypothetical protein|uniref:Uncharacterized protein n=1 Tax=Marinobacter koreensis TaxID=335974 RepID=A0ABW0RQC7_9GAMM|nr:hypothetical protein [Marinobacter koreensis]MCK7549297.1 hypothetical protein [Marinobacter koreensis]MDX1816764.1 hypothetical protein [Marinobacter sp.]
MIIRLFIVLLALNFLAFVVRADAAERPMGESSIAMNTAQEIYQVQQRVRGELGQDSSEAAAEIGSRLLSLTLTRSREDRKHYVSEPAQADHSIALLNNGACLNLKWNF